jgi:16S rRNA A1518/A1519 N6-dimethyltransferase RsmA/KsgA/DIM1 with predicted DNA glycosylase/AP lyase activity
VTTQKLKIKIIALGKIKEKYLQEGIDEFLKRLTPYATVSVVEVQPVQVKDEKYMFEIIRTAFNQRRKMLSNSLSNNPSLRVTRDQVQGALVKMGIDEKARGEVLALSQFAELSDILQSSGAMIN